MTEARTNLFQKLATDHGVKAIVSDRIYPVKLKEGAQIPAISYQLVDGMPLSQAHGEPSSGSSDLYQVNCWGATSAEAKELKEVVKLALDGKSGVWDGADGKLRVTCIYKGQRETPDAAGRLFCRQLDFKLIYATEET